MLKICLIVLLCWGAACSEIGFVSKKNEPISNPLLLDNSFGEMPYVQNFSDSEIAVSRVDVEILSPGVEFSWYFLFYFGKEADGYEAVSGFGKSRVMSDAFYGGLGTPSDQAKERLPGKEKWVFGEVTFSARKWQDLCSDYGGYHCTVNSGLEIKNTAREIDTLNARLIVYWFNWNNSRRDSTQAILYDSTFLPCRLQYVRGPTASDLTSGLQRRSRSGVGVRSTSQGWLVPGTGAWSLRSLDGRTLPVRQESTPEGVMLQPLVPLRGVGVLQGPSGQCAKVLGR